MRTCGCPHNLIDMNTVRIGAGLGFCKRNPRPVLASIERAGVSITSDHLAETVSAEGYGATQHRLRVPPVRLPVGALRANGVRWKSAQRERAGSTRAARRWRCSKPSSARAGAVAVVTGDDVLPRLLGDDASADWAPYRASTPASRWTRARQLVFANAYLGRAADRRCACARCGHHVITGPRGRCGLTLAPLVRGLGWRHGGRGDGRGLGPSCPGARRGALARLCSGQGSGEISARKAWRQIPHDLAHIGCPVAEVAQDGAALLTKPPWCWVNFDTVRQQLLYEVHDRMPTARPTWCWIWAASPCTTRAGPRAAHRRARPTAGRKLTKVVGGYRGG